MSSISFAVEVSVTESGRKRPEYTLDSDLNGEISLQDFLEYVKGALIVTADTVLREEQSMGFDKKPIVVVDGSSNKSLVNVSPFGKIEFVSRVNVGELLIEVYEGLLFRSPVLTGMYKSSHFVFVNGKQVASDMESLKAFLAANPEFKVNDLIRFVNIQPYGRKLERLGVTAQRKQSRTVRSRDKKRAAAGDRVRAPNGAYFLTTRSIKSKYKNNTQIYFTFISGASLGIKGSFKNPGRRGKNSAGRPYLYPTIVIKIREGGSL